jgi:uncharacterized protein (DUF58 family)
MLKTREYAADESQNVVLVFDRYGEPSDTEAFEGLVSRAASLAFHLIRSGARVSLVSDDWRSSSDNSEASLDPILNYLALVEMSAHAPVPSADWPNGAVMLSLRHERE